MAKRFAKSDPWPKPTIVGSLTTPEALTILSRGKCDADLIEIRMDMLLKAKAKPDDIFGAVKSRWHPVLITPRIEKEGGVYKWASSERSDILCRFLSEGVEAIDIELAEAGRMQSVLNSAELAETSVILSAHSIDKPITAKQLERWIEKFRCFLERIPIHVCKIAARVNTQADLQRLASSLTNHADLPWAVMGLGPQAMLSRQVLSGLGSRLVYGYLDQPAAPGQPSARELRKALG